MEPNITQFTWLDIPGFIVKCIFVPPPPPPQKVFFLLNILYCCFCVESTEP